MLEVNPIQLKQTFSKQQHLYTEQNIPQLQVNITSKEDAFLWNMPAGLTTIWDFFSQINFH